MFNSPANLRKFHQRKRDKSCFFEKHYAGARANIEQKPYGASLGVNKLNNFCCSHSINKRFVSTSCALISAKNFSCHAKLNY